MQEADASLHIKGARAYDTYSLKVERDTYSSKHRHDRRITLSLQKRCSVALAVQMRCSVALAVQLRCSVALAVQLRCSVALAVQLRCSVALAVQPEVPVWLLLYK